MSELNIVIVREGYRIEIHEPLLVVVMVTKEYPVNFVSLACKYCDRKRQKLWRDKLFKSLHDNEQHSRYCFYNKF